MSEAESPLQRLRRLEAEERAARAGAPPGEGNAPDAGRRARRGGILAGVIAAVLLAVGKGKFILLLLLTKGKLVLGALKLGPLLTTAGTMGLMIWVYAGIYGAALAAGVVLLILVHELGHGFAARLMNLKVGAPIFIPFFGAVIALKEQPRSTWVEAVVGLGGPLAGLLGGTAVLLTGHLLAPGYWRDLSFVVAWFTFLINFFNLMPVFGLDGDRISQPFAPWYWLPGCLFVCGLAWACVEYLGQVNPFILFIIFLGAVKGGRAWWKQRQRASGRAAPERLVDRLAGRTESQRYPSEAEVLPWQRRASGWAYFGLAGALCVLTIHAHGNLPPIERL